MWSGLFFLGDDFFLGVDLIFFLLLVPGFSGRTVPGRGVPVQDFFPRIPSFLARIPGFLDLQTPVSWSRPRIPGFLALGPQKVGPDPQKPGKRPFLGVCT